jgi:dTDP-4-dehydrorhamnose 3,5-epimerase
MNEFQIGGLTVINAPLEGVRVLRPRKFADHRGFFSETFNQRDMIAAGINHDFVQDNQSLSVTPGTLRGLHFQIPPMAQAKLIRVIRGAILDVVVDIRRSSPTFGHHFKHVLSSDNWDQFYVPVGFAHGFITLEPHTEVLYKVSRSYSPDHDRGVRFDDPDLNIDWRWDTSKLTLSERDRRHPTLSQIQSPFE